MFFITSCQSLSKIWNMFRKLPYLDDLLILTNRSNSFKDHLLKLVMVLARLSTAGMRVNISKSSSLQNKYNTWDTGSPDKVFNLYVTRLRQSLILRSLTLRFPKQEKHNTLRQFIGIVNYYRNMWFRRSELLVRFH
jgi:hypothetical protein